MTKAKIILLASILTAVISIFVITIPSFLHNKQLNKTNTTYTFDFNFKKKEEGEDISKRFRILEIFPSNYIDVVEKNNLNVIQKNRVELLRNGETILKTTDTDKRDFRQYIESFKKSNTPVIVNNQLVMFYYLSQLEGIKQDIVKERILKDLERSINNIKKKGLMVKFLSLLKSTDGRDFLEKIDTCSSMLEQERYDECFDLLKKMNASQYMLFSKFGGNSLDDIDRVNVLLGGKSFLDETQQRDMIKEMFESNLLSANDMEAIQSTEIKYIDQSKEGNSQIDFLLDVDEVFLSEISNFVKFLNGEIKKVNYSSRRIERFVENIDRLKNGKDTNVALNEIINSVNYKPNSILLRSSKKEVEVLYALPTVQLKEIYPEVVDENFNEEYEYTPLAQSSGSVRIPTMMYHIIGTTDSSSKFVAGLHVSPDVFERQIAYITRKNYKSLNSEEFDALLSGGVNPKQKSIMLSFDDGTPTHYSTAFPILKKYGHKGVFFDITQRSMLTDAQVKEMSDAGMDIQSHTQTHKLLQYEDSATQQREIGSSKVDIEGITGKRVIAIAYPGCVGNSASLSIARSSGYRLGFSCGRGIDMDEKSRYYLPRIHAFNDFDLFVKSLSIGLVGVDL